MENPYYQFFCGEEFFQLKLVLDRSSPTRWRQRMGEEKRPRDQYLDRHHTLGSASFQLASDGAGGTFVTTAADADGSSSRRR